MILPLIVFTYINNIIDRLIVLLTLIESKTLSTVLASIDFSGES